MQHLSILSLHFEPLFACRRLVQWTCRKLGLNSQSKALVMMRCPTFATRLTVLATRLSGCSVQQVVASQAHKRQWAHVCRRTVTLAPPTITPRTARELETTNTVLQDTSRSLSRHSAHSSLVTHPLHNNRKRHMVTLSRFGVEPGARLGEPRTPVSGGLCNRWACKQPPDVGEACAHPGGWGEVGVAGRAMEQHTLKRRCPHRQQLPQHSQQQLTATGGMTFLTLQWLVVAVQRWPAVQEASVPTSAAAVAEHATAPQQR